MAEFEVLEAKRPLESTGWVEDVADESGRMVGEDVFDFQDGQLAAEGIVLLSAEEQVKQYRQGKLLGNTATTGAIKIIGDRMPRSFLFPAAPGLKKTGLDIIGGRNDQRKLIAYVRSHKNLGHERGALTGSINQYLRKDIRWRNKESSIGIILATMQEGAAVDRKILKALGRRSLPERAYTSRGKLSHRTVEPY